MKGKRNLETYNKQLGVTGTQEVTAADETVAQVWHTTMANNPCKMPGGSSQYNTESGCMRQASCNRQAVKFGKFHSFLQLQLSVTDHTTQSMQ